MYSKLLWVSIPLSRCGTLSRVSVVIDQLKLEILWVNGFFKEAAGLGSPGGGHIESCVGVQRFIAIILLPFLLGFCSGS